MGIRIPYTQIPEIFELILNGKSDKKSETPEKNVSFLVGYVDRAKTLHSMAGHNLPFKYWTSVVFGSLLYSVTFLQFEKTANYVS